MKTNYRSLGFVLIILHIVSCASVAMKGKIDGGRYYSPLNNFNITLPPVESDKEILEQLSPGGDGRIYFPNVILGLSVVTYYKIDAPITKIIDDPGKRDAIYRDFLKSYIIPKLFKRVSPQTAILKEDFIDANGDRVYFAVVNIPNGSMMRDIKNNKSLDSIRALLVFHRIPFMYMLEIEMNNPGSWINPSSLDNKKVQYAQAQLKRMKEDMSFK